MICDYAGQWSQQLRQTGEPNATVKVDQIDLNGMGPTIPEGVFDGLEGHRHPAIEQELILTEGM
ncbi:hypothetical protein [Sphingopyxis fribergensis]